MITIKNNYGISVNMICASCMYKRNINQLTTRECVRTKRVKKVKPRGHCKYWEMSEGLQNAGNLNEVNS